MGREAQCVVSFQGRSSEGKALLETDELVFRGEPRLKIPYKQIRAIDAKDGRLTVEWPGGTAVFELGTEAAKWAQRILHPPSLLDKLGVKPGTVVAVLGVADPDFRRQLRERVGDFSDGCVAAPCDLIFVAAESREELAALAPLRASLKPSGGVWVVYPKGQRHITQNDVFAAGKDAGLVDVKVARFSDTHTALRFVIPLARRKTAG